MSNKTQTIKIKAKTKCGHSPIYTLNDYYVYDSPNTNEPKVNQKTGKVTFDKNWMGNAWIEIYVPACEHYTEASKEIKITVRPVSPKLKSVSVPRAKWINIEWQKNSNIDGYQIQMSESPKFNKKKGKMKTYEVPSYRLSWTISGKLIKGKKYYVRMRSYIAGYYEKFYSKWCDTKSVTAR